QMFQSPDWYRAATLRERTSTLPAVCGPPIEGALAARRMKRWGEQPPFPSGSYFEQRLAADGLGGDHLLYCLGEPAESLQNRLGEPPDWLVQLAAQFSGSPCPVREFLQAPGAAGFLAVIEPMIQNGVERVEHGAQAVASSDSSAPFDPHTATEALFAN